MKNNDEDYTLTKSQLSNPQFILQALIPFAVGDSIAHVVYNYATNIPAKLRDFLYKKRPFPTEKEFGHILDEYNLKPTASFVEDYPADSLVFHLSNPDFALCHVEYDDTPEDRIQYMGDLNNLKITPIFEFDLPDGSDSHKVFQQTVKLWKNSLSSRGLPFDFELLYQGYLSMIKILTKQNTKPFDKILTKAEMTFAKNTSNLMTVSRLIENQDGSFTEGCDCFAGKDKAGEYKDNFYECFDKIKAAKQQNQGFYAPFKIYIYHSIFEPANQIKMNGKFYSKFGILPDEIINITNADGKGLSIENPLVVLTNSKAKADKQFKQWAKLRGYYITKDNLRGTSNKISK